MSAKLFTSLRTHKQEITSVGAEVGVEVDGEQVGSGVAHMRTQFGTSATKIDSTTAREMIS